MANAQAIQDFPVAGISPVEQAYFLEAELNQLPSRPIQIAILLTESVQIVDAISKAVEGTYGKEQRTKVHIFLRDSPEYLSMKTAETAPFYDREWPTRLLTLQSSAIP
jgi:hypothetical protein